MKKMHNGFDCSCTYTDRHLFLRMEFVHTYPSPLKNANQSGVFSIVDQMEIQ